MKSNVLIIMKKELTRFFTDRRMVITTLLLPGLMVYLIYSIMGTALTDKYSEDETYTYRVSAVNFPDALEGYLGAANMEIAQIGDADREDALTALRQDEADLLVVFPENFDRAVEEFEPNVDHPVPDIEIYYNSSSTDSSYAYSIVTGILSQYESSVANVFNINQTGDAHDVATSQETAGVFLSQFLPMIIMAFLFSGCMAVAPESIAGEKERGTIATLLVTPLKRSELAIGKIASLSMIALLCGLSSFVGVVLSLPKMVGVDFTASFYSAGDYLVILLVIFSVILVNISLISVISAYMKTVKEAAAVILPLMVLSMLAGLTPMLSDGAPTAFYWYMIPIYNCAQCLNGVLSFNSAPASVLVTIAANVVFSALMILLLTKMFNSEKIMFKR